MKITVNIDCFDLERMLLENGYNFTLDGCDLLLKYAKKHIDEFDIDYKGITSMVRELGERFIEYGEYCGTGQDFSDFEEKFAEICGVPRYEEVENDVEYFDYLEDLILKANEKGWILDCTPQETIVAYA